MTILCSPKDKDGKRTAVNNSCSEKCPFWGKCLEEIGIQELPNHFIEKTPNKYELEDGIFHVDYKGLKKVWILTKKQYGC